MRQLSLSYANPNSGKNSAIIAWINFGNISLSPGETLTGLYVKFNDGSTLSFDLTNTSSSNILLNSTSVPVTSTSSFGYSNYTNISGTPALIADVSNESHSALFEISNISYLNSSGFHINDYTLYIADLYASNSSENLSGNLQQYITNGSPWLVEELIGIGSTPSIEITDESSTPITTFDLNDITNEAMYAYDFEGRRYDVGDKLGFLQATVEFALKREELREPFIQYLNTKPWENETK